MTLKLALRKARLSIKINVVRTTAMLFESPSGLNGLFLGVADKHALVPESLVLCVVVLDCSRNYLKFEMHFAQDVSIRYLYTVSERSLAVNNCTVCCGTGTIDSPNDMRNSNTRCFGAFSTTCGHISIFP